MTKFPELAAAMQAVSEYYRQRGIFQAKFGFGQRPAIVVVDFAYAWTDDSYAGGSRLLDGPVECTRQLLDAARSRRVPIVFTTSPYRPDAGNQPFKSALDASPGFRPCDARACQIDERLGRRPEELLIEKENASAFFGTHLVSFLIQQQIDTLLITGCSTSACIRATATDAKSYRLHPMIIEDCVGDRAPAAHAFTLFDIQARFADVVSLAETLRYLETLPA